jgi:hypothetical protein
MNENTDPSLAGLRAALTAAARAPKDGQARAVTRVRGRDVTLICTITDGHAAWPPGSAVIPARPRKDTKS